MTGLYLGRTLQDAIARAEYDKTTLPQIVQVEPADYDRIILVEYIRILEEIVALQFRDMHEKLVNPTNI